MIDIPKLRKIWALTKSANAGEAAAARGRAEVLVRKHGKTLADVEGLLAEAPPQNEWRGFSGRNPFEGFDDWMEREQPGYKAKATAAAEAKRQAKAAYLQSVILKYGSIDAGKAASPLEASVDLAAHPFRTVIKKKFANGVFPTESLSGWTGFLDGDLPQTVKKALSAVDTSIMESIVKAKAEYDWWEERDRELGALYGDTIGDTYLSLACQVRRDLVCDLLKTGLRARDLQDVLARQRYLIESGHTDEAVERAVLADLEHLAKLEQDRRSKPMHSKQQREQTQRDLFGDEKGVK